VRFMQRFESLIVNGMCVLAVFVQLFVYGATKIRSRGALLDNLVPYFGTPYALGFLLLQLWYCHSCRRQRGYWFIAAVWLACAALSLSTHVLGVGRPFQFGEWLALTTGLTALTLWAGYHSGYT
jgi:hypothetical protein